MSRIFMFNIIISDYFVVVTQVVTPFEILVVTSKNSPWKNYIAMTN